MGDAGYDADSAQLANSDTGAEADAALFTTLGPAVAADGRCAALPAVVGEFLDGDAPRPAAAYHGPPLERPEIAGALLERAAQAGLDAGSPRSAARGIGALAVNGGRVGPAIGRSAETAIVAR